VSIEAARAVNDLEFLARTDAELRRQIFAARVQASGEAAFSRALVDEGRGEEALARLAPWITQGSEVKFDLSLDYAEALVETGDFGEAFAVLQQPPPHSRTAREIRRFPSGLFRKALFALGGGYALALSQDVRKINQWRHAIANAKVQLYRGNPEAARYLALASLRLEVPCLYQTIQKYETALLLASCGGKEQAREIVEKGPEVDFFPNKLSRLRELFQAVS
jgi:thioredoxin-like negative regulator of GroEL